MGVIKSLAGTVRIEIVSADIGGFLSAAASRGVEFLDTQYLSDLSICGTVYRRDYGKIKALADRRGEKIKIRQRNGFYWKLKSLLRRPLFLLGLAALLLMVAYLPSRIFFVRVEGNTSIPTKMILEYAEYCGIRFGASRRAVRSEKMKNALLSQLPQLQWAGINTTGCVAVISVQERSLPEAENRAHRVSSIIADRDCVIESCTVTSGNALCRVGQAVKAGQTLVSGYTDCGLSIVATRSQAEIFGQTSREIQAISPAATARRGEQLSSKRKYSIQIGKNVIKFYKDSGISHGICVKMYTKKNLVLPGGFRLPVALICEQEDCYAEAPVETPAFDWVEDYCREYLKGQMIAGEILGETLSQDPQQSFYKLTGRYSCKEMIGYERNEETMK